MPLRVVVYAEGPAEDAGSTTRLPPPGDELGDEHLGPAHRLARRCLAALRDDLDFRFVAPLRTPDAKRPRGSSLRDDPRVLRRLLTWVGRRQPDLALVFLDQDGDSSLHTRLEGALQGIDLPWVLAIPAPEFESWLLADLETARRQLGVDLEQPPDPEAMSRGEAKERLNAWLSRAGQSSSPDEDRRSIRQDYKSAYFGECRLDALRKLRSFENFERDLRYALKHIAR